MNELTKTLTFVGVAAVVLIIAAASRPRPPQPDPESRVGKVLNAVDDPLSATALEIVKYNEDTAAIRSFEVAQVDGRWAIPSHQNYPADAAQQMADAAVSVMNLDILKIESTNPGAHELYGVVEPSRDLTPGASGVGTKVVMKDAKDDVLVGMVIGKEVKDGDGLRYVREVGKDPVYLVKFDAGKLSTDFADWIEKDLLKLSTWDIRQLKLNDYSAELALSQGGVRPFQDPRSEILLDYDDGKSEWKISQMRLFDPESQEFIEQELGEDEELDATKLNDLKSALDDLKIVDVERKPEGLSEDLKAEKEFATQEAYRSLLVRGFYLVQGREGIEVLSSEGEVICRLKDGVEYVLRFGKLVVGAEGEQASGQDPETDQEDAKEEGSSINRYLFVSARLNENMIPQPELQELPGEETGADDEAPAVKEGGEAEEPAAQPESETQADEKADSDAPAGEQDAKESEGDETAAGAEANDDQAASGEASDVAEDAAEDETESADETESDKAKVEAAKPAEDNEEPEKTDEEPSEASPTDGQSDEDEKAKADARDRIKKENQRKLDEYHEKVNKAKDKVSELNQRFGDWYYVISDSVYKKIHLGAPDIIKQKEKPEDEKTEDDPGKAGETIEGAGLDALQGLEKEGIKGAE